MYSDGGVYVASAALLTASCFLDISTFPFDSHTCILQFTASAPGGGAISIQLNEDVSIQASQYVDNLDWDLLNKTLELQRDDEKRYLREATGRQSYDVTAVTATFEISRRTGMYNTNLLIPSVLTAFLVLFTFLLPPSSGEKIVFCLTTMLSLFLLLIYLRILVPSNSSTALSEFLTFALCLDFFATLLAVLSYGMSKWILGGTGSIKTTDQKVLSDFVNK